MSNNTGNTLNEYYQAGKNTAKGTADVASTLKFLQNPNTTGGQRLAKIVSLIMSFGGEAATDSIET